MSSGVIAGIVAILLLVGLVSLMVRDYRKVTGPQIIYKGVQVYPMGSAMRMVYRGKDFRSYSEIDPPDNRWTLKDGTPATAEEHDLFVEATEEYRRQLRDPWSGV